MNAFYVTAEYVDPETGEWVSENVLIDDFPYQETAPFAPEPDNSGEYPW